MEKEQNRRILAFLLNLLYPIKCPFCGVVTNDGICRDCRKRLPYVMQPRCMTCGKPVRTPEQEFCADCAKIRHEFEEGRSLWLHKGRVSDAIYALKYKNLRINGEIFGKELARYYGGYLKKQGVELLVPVPLHWKRRIKRGYNQAEILAEFLGRYSGIPVDKHLLRRVKYTEAQKNLDHNQRRRNVRGAFQVKGRLTAKRIAVIDDIYTTGSTIDEAAVSLKRAGAEKVYFLTISIGQGF
ncbi:ComF family protein [Roseburia hominis]